MPAARRRSRSESPIRLQHHLDQLLAGEPERRLVEGNLGAKLGAMATPALPAKFLQPVSCSGESLL